MDREKKKQTRITRRSGRLIGASSIHDATKLGVEFTRVFKKKNVPYEREVTIVISTCGSTYVHKYDV